MTDSPPYWTYKVIPEPPLVSPEFIDFCRRFNEMLNIGDLEEPDSEEAVYTQNVVSTTKEKLFALTNPKGGRLSAEIQNSQEFAVQQIEYFISFMNSDVNWETVCQPLCKTKSPEELHNSVLFLDSLLESFRNSDKTMEPKVKSIIAKTPDLKEFYAEMSSVVVDENHYDKLQSAKKSLVTEYKILEHKIELISILKKKHHPLRLSVKPVLKFIRDMEEGKKDVMDADQQPKAKKQKTFTEILGDYFGIGSD